MSTDKRDPSGRTLDDLEAALWASRIDRRTFIRLALAVGTSIAGAEALAGEVDSIQQNQRRLAANLGSSYDFIVCGAGSSGCVVARRLAEKPGVRVLLLEAGGTDDLPSIVAPERWYLNVGTNLDWGFMTEPSASLNGRSIREPMGKVLGGGSSINASAWARGHRNDFEGWAAAAKNADWGYEHVLSIYRRIENWCGPADPARRGTSGLLWVEPAHDPVTMAPAYVKAAQSIGIPTYDDMNGALMEGPGGAAIANLRIREGRRVNIPTSYLRPIMAQPNLTVLTGAEVLRIKLKGKRATGVIFSWGGNVRETSATREVILSMGAIQTPFVLMHSGIGDEAELKRVGLEVVEHVPGVGRNFRDHTMLTGLMWEPREPFEARNNSAEACLFWKSDSSLPTPDLQLWQVELPFVNEVTGPRCNAPASSWSISPCLVRPRSVGHLKLRSNNPHEGFAIYANMLQEKEDVRALARGVELAREIGNSQAMQPFVKREVGVGRLAGAELENFIRDAAVSYFHATCTCRMGHDEMAVVDDQLRVRGIEHLRIADGSAMPDLTTGNTMAGCVIIGERMGEILGRAL